MTVCSLPLLLLERAVDFLRAMRDQPPLPLLFTSPLLSEAHTPPHQCHRSPGHCVPEESHFLQHSKEHLGNILQIALTCVI